jgi:hypothetical protein
VDFAKAFTFPFEDDEWVTKLLIGGILGLIPIVNLVVLGYALRTLKNVADGVEKPLPSWDDFADYFVKGLVSLLGGVIWALPILVVAGLTVLLGLATEQSPNAGYTGPFNACIMGLSCLSSLYGLFLSAVLPAAFAEYAISGEFASLFRFGEIFRGITSNLGNYVMAALLAWLAQLVAGFGIILCIVGVVFTQFWATLVGAHLFGQVYSGAPKLGSELAA